MSPADVRYIRTSFALLSQDPDGLAAEFYNRLFTIAPSVRSLFKADLHDKGKKLVNMLAVVVHNLDRLDTLVGAVHALGRRHAHYGVRDEHYDQVGRRFSRPWRRPWDRPSTLMCVTPSITVALRY